MNLTGEEVEKEFKIGDIVRCVEHDPISGLTSGAGWEKGLEFKIKSITKFKKYQCCFVGAAYGVYGPYLELVNKSSESKQKSKTKENKTMNKTIKKMYAKNTGEEMLLVEKHFGSNFDSLNNLQAFLIKDKSKEILAEAKRLQDVEDKEKLAK